VKEYQEIEILKDAIYHFGYNHQSTKCIEEMSELIKEICKNKDGQQNVEHIAEEIADVLITIDQMIIYHDIYDAVAQFRQEKLERLRQKLFMEQYG
jgi:NTP pyrophosphatase (non-canonical NTP hydrolase)